MMESCYNCITDDDLTSKYNYTSRITVIKTITAAMSALINYSHLSTFIPNPRNINLYRAKFQEDNQLLWTI